MNQDSGPGAARAELGAWISAAGAAQMGVCAHRTWRLSRCGGGLGSGMGRERRGRRKNSGLFPAAQKVAAACPGCPQNRACSASQAAHPVSAGLQVGCVRTEGPGRPPPEL